MKRLKVVLALIIAVCMLLCTACGQTEEKKTSVQTFSTVNYENAKVIVLSEDGTATIDGQKINSFDYTWNADPSTVHDEVKNCPAWYYEGTEPDTTDAAYIAKDIIYYPQLEESGFTKVNYDGETEYVYYYTDGTNNDYIFSTLPVLGNSFPSQMMHTKEEAAANPVLHIKEPGTYVLQGSWKGQVYIDLGDEDENFADETKKVTIVLAGVDIECSVAPAIVFDDLYECDNTWEEKEEHSGVVDTTNAGANVVIADGTTNNVTGANVFRLLKTKYKDENSTDEVKVQKKAVKMDGAFYSFVSMNISSEKEESGKLIITSTTFEGLDSELHLTINSGDITIYSQDDGSNVNEDDVSVFTMNGGSLHIYAGLGAEGDGIDSNGYITINGGTLVACASPISDNGLDSECGTEINGGNVVALGSSMGGTTYTVYVNGKLQYGSSITSEFGPGGKGGFNPGERGDFDPTQGGDFDPTKMGDFDPTQKGNFDPTQKGQNQNNPPEKPNNSN